MAYYGNNRATQVYKYTSSSFGRTSLLDMLREKVVKASNGELDSNSSDDAVPAEVHDPMDMVDAPAQSPSPKKGKISGWNGSRERFYKNVAKSTIFYTEMPEKTPGEDPNGTAKRVIALYIHDRQTIWLAIEDVPWAVRFLYVQNMLKGVPLVQSDSTGPCEDIAGESQPRDDGE